jgi:hypothetical protein
MLRQCRVDFLPPTIFEAPDLQEHIGHHAEEPPFVSQRNVGGGVWSVLLNG